MTTYKLTDIIIADILEVTPFLKNHPCNGGSLEAVSKLIATNVILVKKDEGYEIIGFVGPHAPSLKIGSLVSTLLSVKVEVDQTKIIDEKLDSQLVIYRQQPIDKAETRDDRFVYSLEYIKSIVKEQLKRIYDPKNLVVANIQMIGEVPYALGMFLDDKTVMIPPAERKNIETNVVFAKTEEGYYRLFPTEFSIHNFFASPKHVDLTGCWQEELELYELSDIRELSDLTEETRLSKPEVIGAVRTRCKSSLINTQVI